MQSETSVNKYFGAEATEPGGDIGAPIPFEYKK